MAMYDSIWRDDEAGAWSYVDTTGTTDLQRRGIDWPELEEKRRREAAGAPPPPPLPGSVEDPYGTAAPPRDGGTVAPPRSPRAQTPPPAREGDGTSRAPRVIGRAVGGTGGGGSAPPPPPAPPPSDSAGARREERDQVKHRGRCGVVLAPPSDGGRG